MESTVNLGILAHVDAGKTSLTERLLHAVGVVDTLGSVDKGSTLTDSLGLERQRGITIKSAVASFMLGETKVNLIDNPGHPDFIAEVERVLNVLDGAILVVSAVEGVQAQTRVLLRTLRRLRIPTLIFVNKIDRVGARYNGVLHDIAEGLFPAVIPMGLVKDLGTRSAQYLPYGGADSLFTSRLTEVLASHDDVVLAEYVNAEVPLSYEYLRGELAKQTEQMLVHPVFFGSAITGAGIDSLISGLIEFLPPAQGDPESPVSGTVFKIERGPGGEKIAYVRLFAGTIQTRERLSYGRSREDKVIAIDVFDRGLSERRKAIHAGEIARLWGLTSVRIGDSIGRSTTLSEEHYFAPPTLATIVMPRRPEEKGKLHSALVRLAEQDPLINLRQDDIRQELTVSLYGEVQKEIIESVLADEYGIEVFFRDTTVICIERPIDVGTAVEFIGKDPNPFLATVGLRIEPATVNSGIRFRLEIELGSLPLAFVTAVEDTVKSTLSQGLYGWQVTDCLVVMTHSGYWARQSHAHGTFDKSMSSTAGDFKNLTPLVLMDALKKAGTTVCEPIHRFRLEVPVGTLSVLLSTLSRFRAIPEATRLHSASCLIEGTIPAANVHRLNQRLPGLTYGEGFLEYTFDHYETTSGPVPIRSRTGRNPLNRSEYLLGRLSDPQKR